MIFVTVGTQLPFDRLLYTVENAFQSIENLQIIAQIGQSSFFSSKIETYKEMTIAEFNDCVVKSSLIIGHAGIGTILTAAAARKPVCIMPRRAEFNEHRNNHQVGTSERFATTNGCYIFNNEKELITSYKKSLEISFDSPITDLAPYETVNNLNQIISEIINEISYEKN